MSTEVASKKVDFRAVEDSIRAHPSVLDCTVFQRDRVPSGPSLVAYVVPVGRLSMDLLKAHLISKLPEIKLPDFYVPVTRLPLTDQGEVDRRALANVLVIDERLVQRLEKRVAELVGDSELAVVVQDRDEDLPPIHLSDLFIDLPNGTQSSAALESTGISKSVAGGPGKPSISEGRQLPEDSTLPKTLPDTLRRAAEKYAKHGVRYVLADGSMNYQPYPDLLNDARRILAGLQEQGVKAGDKVLFQLDHNQDFITSFWACMLGGFVPVPLTVPASFENNDSAAERLQNAWQMLGHPVVLAGESNVSALQSLSSVFRDGELIVVSIESVRASNRDPIEHNAAPEDVALILLTSGSTGVPKGVVQHHRSILSRSAATIHYDEFNHNDVSLNWFPLDHVGGLVMFHVRDVLAGCQQIHVPTQYVLENPLRWLGLVDQYRVSITWAPNFAFGLVNALHEEIVSGHWNLSCLRFILNGGEAIVAKTARRFLQLLAPHGLPKTAMRPAWGMSETCSGVTSSHCFSLEKSADDDQFVEVGEPLPGVSLRIVDSRNEVVIEGAAGSLQVKGPMVTSGYYQNRDLNGEAFSPDGWFITGDLAVLREGRLTITGREKDVIIVNGINIHGHEIEALVESIPGITPSFTAACAVRLPGKNTDDLIVFFHSRHSDSRRLGPLLQEIRGRIVQTVGVNPAYLVPVAEGEIPKTAIGKIQRTQLRSRFLAGEFNAILKSVDVESANANTLPEWFFKPVWRRKELRGNASSVNSGIALIFTDEFGLAGSLKANLRETFDTCITVTPGTKFARLSRDQYSLSPGQAEHYRLLVQALANDGCSPDVVLHLWTYGDQGDSRFDDFDRDLDLGLYSILFLIQALRPSANRQIHLLAVSSDSQPIIDADELTCVRSMIPGLLLAASAETPFLHCRHVDLPKHEVKLNADRLSQELRFDGDPEVAYRNGHRLVPRLERVQFKDDVPSHLPFGSGKTYLISGGLGGIGVELARYLLKKNNARVLLIGRSPLPNRSRWSELSPNDPVFSRIKVLQELERLGDVCYEVADVAEIGELRLALGRALSVWGGQLDGVFHLAGVYHDQLLADETREAFASVLRPKVLGALALNELIKDQPNCRFVSFSSAVSFFGGSMVGAYAAANRFLDAFALYQKRHNSQLSFCIGWTSWSDVGMSRGYGGKEPLRARGIQDLSVEQGLHSLLGGLQRDHHRLLIGLDGSNPYIRRHLDEESCELKKLSAFVAVDSLRGDDIPQSVKIRDAFGTRTSCDINVVRELPRTASGEIDREHLVDANQKRSSASQGKVAPRTDTERQIAAIWQQLLGVPRVGIQDSFFELGGHSLLAMQLISRLRSELGIEISQRTLFQAPTIIDLLQQTSTSRSSSTDSRPPIETVPRNGDLPLSFAQQRLWFIDQLEPGGSSYNTSIAFALLGDLKVSCLQRSLDEIVRRHEILRTTFPAKHGMPIQTVAHVRKQQLPVVDLRHIDLGDREIEASRIAGEEARRAFDLAHDPLLRTTLLQLNQQQHWLLVTMHHIVADGWSLGVFRRELAALYASFCSGTAASLPDLPIQFADYAVWQRQWLQGDFLNEQLNYWKKQLAGAPSLLELPLDRPRPPMQSYRGSHINFAIPPALSAKIKKTCQTEKVTLFMALMAVFQTLLARLSGQDEVVTATAIANRGQRETENLIGCLINVLLLRTNFADNLTFRKLVAVLRETALDAYAHQDLPFERLVEELHPQRDLSFNPLAQTMFVWLNEPVDQLDLAGLRITSIDLEDAATQYDLILHMWEKDGGLAGMLHYGTDIFEASTAQQIVGQFQRLLEIVVDCPDTPVLNLQILSESERRRTLVEWNDTYFDYPRDLCIHQLFEQQVAVSPEAVAVTDGTTNWSYGELNRRADQLASYLSKRGVGPDVLVALCVDRSFEMMVGLLGILKAGGAYVPLDPAYPSERLAFMLEDCQASILLTQKHLVEGLPKSGAEPICLDSDWEKISGESDEPLQVAATPANLAYVIYTSGSTGRPKGVEIPHRAVVNFLSTMARQPGLTKQDRLLAVTTLSFDIAGLELFLPLAVGARVILVSREIAADGAQLIKALEQSQATVLQATPSTWRLLLEAGWQGDHELKALCGGEALPRSLADQLIDKCFCLWNMYGPTETTIWSLIHPIVAGQGPVLIGKPIGNTQVYIVDSQMQPVPVGVAGELLIGGDGIARGYRNRPELTAEKFVKNPFGCDTSPSLYRTGDLARWRTNGTIECLGRLDFQVKIRGHRIELGDIETALGNHPDVREVVVVAREDSPGDKRLIAYLTVDRAARLSIAELRAYLKGKLPESMVPSAFVIVEALPRTPNGKIDRKNLPVPSLDRSTLAQNYVAPQSSDEKALAEIWCRLLKLDQVGTNDNFFELGGQSLLATQVVWQIKDALQVELPVRVLFEAPTIAGVANHLQSARSKVGLAKVPLLTPVSRELELPLSFAQQRFWFVDQLAGGNAAANLFAAYQIVGPLIISGLERSILEITQRHESLRTVFPSIGGRPVQVITEGDTLGLTVVDLRHLSTAERAAEAKLRAGDEVLAPFDLARGPLLRTTLYRLSDSEHILVVVAHHIVADGWSLGIFSREMAELYSAFSSGQASPLMPLPIQYADYAVWQRGWLQGDVLQEQLKYWKEQLAGVPTLLELPTDRPRPPVQSFRGSRHDFKLSRELSAALQSLSQREGVTLFMTLMAAFQVLLSRYSGQERFIVSTGIANRDRQETKGLIGCLINILLLRADLAGNPTFRDLLQIVRETALGAYSHQDLPFERLVEELQPERDLSYNPLTQAMFVLLNEPMDCLDLPGLEVRSINVEMDSTQYDVVMHMWETNDGLSGFCHFSTDLFDGETIVRMVNHFQELLASIVAEPHNRVLELDLLTVAERHLMIEQWNNTSREFPHERCLHELFEIQVEHNPDAVAVIFGDRRLTYGELNDRSNQLANFLRRCGVGPDVLVGLCVERSFEMVVGILGTMKAGGAYVPLDPSYPLERLDFMLADTNAPVLLTQKHLQARLGDTSARVICLDEEWPEIAKEPVNAPTTGVGPQHLSYVIFTSGSTGTPKGIALRHQGVVNNICDLNWRHGVGTQDRMLALSSLSFDMCVYEVFGTLEAGAAIVMPHPDELREPAAWAALMKQHRVTIWNSAPALLKMLVDYTESRPDLWPRHLHLSILGGDWVPVTLPDRLKAMAPQVRFIVLGGATEASIHSIIFPVVETDPSWTSIPYGVPQYNQKAFILNSSLQTQPIGVAGELYLGGIGLARGYHNRPALTASKFIPNPFATDAGERIYATGDLARYRADGVIELIGRMDHQIKLRGMRIECGEIEACIRQHPAIREAVVAARDYSGDKRLIAYVRTNSEAPACKSKNREIGQNGHMRTAHWANQEQLLDDLRAYVKSHLPDYMVPTTFVLMEELPLSPNGKVDRKALPTPELVRVRSESTASRPSTSTEAVIAKIWANVLSVEEVGLDENFFDLGGHSLLATQVISQVREAFQTELPLRALFEAPTVVKLAQRIDAAQSTNVAQIVPLVPVSRAEPLPLSFAQERLWFIDQLLPGSASYNIPLAFRLSGALHVDALTASLAAIVRRHEVLRTSFPTVGDRPVQSFANPESFRLSTVDLTHLPDADREVETNRLANAEAQQPFNLANGPLFRTTLIRLGLCDHLLLVTLHHAIVDGWSLNLFCAEMAALYSAHVAGLDPHLSDLPIQYADYAVWQRKWLTGAVLAEQMSYWKGHLASAPLTLELPTDHPRPPVQTLRGARHFFTMPTVLAESITAFGRHAGATPFMTLLAGFKTLLHAYTGRTDLLVGSPFANRTRAETESIMGPFVNTVVLRTRLDNNPSFRELLHRVREVVLTADAHQDFPFEKIVEVVRPPRDPSRNPLFQVNFRVVMSPLEPPHLPGVDARLRIAPTINSKFDLAQELWISTKEFGGYFEYCTDLFDDATVRQMATDFEQLLTDVLAQPDCKLIEIKTIQEIRARLVGGKIVAPSPAEPTTIKGLKDVRRKAVRLSEPDNLEGKKQ